MADTNYWNMLAKQNKGFGSYGSDMLTSSLSKPTGLAESSFSQVMNNNPAGYGEANSYFGNQGFGESGGTSLLGDTKNLLSDRSFMSGLAGVGQLGLGLAQYLSMKPVYKEQLAGLKQNRQFAAEDQARRDRTAANFDKVLT